MAKKMVLRIVTEKERIKVVGETTLYFGLNYKDKTIALISPEGQSISYYMALEKEISGEKHKAFVKTYAAGIAYAEKMFQMTPGEKK